MKKTLSKICISIIILGCSSFTQAKEIQKEINSNTIISSNINQVELENILKNFKHNKDSNLKFTFVEKIDNQYVLVDEGYPSISNIKTIYFLKKNNGIYYIDKIIGQKEMYGDINNFIVTNINKKMDYKFNELGSLMDELIGNNEQNKTIQGDISKPPYIAQLAKIDSAVISYRYDNNNQVSNRSPKFVINYKGKNYLLKDNQTIFIGYDYSNLKLPMFIGIKDNKTEKYKFYYKIKKFIDTL